MKTTIEVYTIKIRKGHDYIDFGSDPDFLMKFLMIIQDLFTLLTVIAQGMYSR